MIKLCHQLKDHSNQKTLLNFCKIPPKYQNCT